MAFVNHFIGLSLSMLLTITLQKLCLYNNQKGGKNLKKGRDIYIHIHGI